MTVLSGNPPLWFRTKTNNIIGKSDLIENVSTSVFHTLCHLGERNSFRYTPISAYATGELQNPQEIPERKESAYGQEKVCKIGYSLHAVYFKRISVVMNGLTRWNYKATE